MVYQFGLIGYPIKHSLSPWIHKQFLTRSGLTGDYSIIEIDPNSNISESITALRKMELDGFNITVPYKQTIIDYLDDLDESALQIGAVNTVLCKNNRWIGYNTDGIGYVRSLERKYPEIMNRKTDSVLILGAGGACKGIYHGLLANGYRHITLANRTKQKAEAIANAENVITLEEAQQNITKFGIIIQTTSVGMKPHQADAVIDLYGINRDTIVSDIVYQPLMTTFLNQAKQLGAKVHLGHTMLLYQAQYAFEIWTNEQSDMTGLDQQLQMQLEG